MYIVMGDLLQLSPVSPFTLSLPCGYIHCDIACFRKIPTNARITIWSHKTVKESCDMCIYWKGNARSYSILFCVGLGLLPTSNGQKRPLAAMKLFKIRQRKPRLLGFEVKKTAVREGSSSNTNNGEAIEQTAKTTTDADQKSWKGTKRDDDDGDGGVKKKTFTERLARWGKWWMLLPCAPSFLCLPLGPSTRY